MIGVITADIVDSRKIPPPLREALYHDIADFLADLKKNKHIKNFETFRGDSFQCIASEANKTLALAVLIRSFFKKYSHQDQHTLKREKSKKGYYTSKYDVRIGIGIGASDFIHKSRTSLSDGEAFYFAAEALNAIAKTNYRIQLITTKKEINGLLEPSMLLLDAVIQKWTSNQAEIVFHKLQQKQEDEISVLLNISQSAVNQRTKTSNWHAIEKFITLVENNLEKWN